MKLIVMKGLPASGKSTLAQAIIENSGNTVRVNRDLLRTMLHFDKWTPKNEELTIRAATALVRSLTGYANIIVDDTNLDPRTIDRWKGLAKEFDYVFEVRDLTNVSSTECVARDSLRAYLGQRSVGKSVIRNMALRYGFDKFEPDSVVICDLDGTLCDIEHRLHYVKGPVKQWRNFFEALERDSVRADVRTRLDEFALNGKTIILMSGRPDRYASATRDWLHRHGIHDYWTLIMRRDGDHRPDDVVKAELLEKHFRDLSVIHEVIDDRPSVIRMWRGKGLKVHDVGAGVEF